MSVKIVPHPRRIQCDLCSSRDTFMVSRESGRVGQFLTICREELKDTVLKGLELFKDEIELPVNEVVPADYEELKTRNNDLSQEIEGLKAEIKKLVSDNLERLSAENKTLEVKCEELQKVQDKPVSKPTQHLRTQYSSKSNNGGKKK